MLGVSVYGLSQADVLVFGVCQHRCRDRAFLGGLLLCLFVGPTLGSARALMMRMSAEGKEGVAFGLYTTTGRAVSFLAPWMFFTFVDLFDSDRAVWLVRAWCWRRAWRQ